MRPQQHPSTAAHTLAALGTLAWLVGSLLTHQYWLTIAIGFTAVPATIFCLAQHFRRLALVTSR